MSTSLITMRHRFSVAHLKDVAIFGAKTASNPFRSASKAHRILAMVAWKWTDSWHKKVGSFALALAAEFRRRK